MSDTLAGASPVDQPVGRPLPKRYEGGRIKGGCSLHDAEKPELCQKHLQRCPEPRTVDCCGVVDEHEDAGGSAAMWHNRPGRSAQPVGDDLIGGKWRWIG